MKNKINVFTGNHKRIEGIRDHIEIIKEIEPLGFEVEYSNDIILGAINVVIEEFSDADFKKRLKTLKKEHPSLVLILVMTEVPDYDLRGRLTLNPHLSPAANKSFLLMVEWLPFFLRRGRDHALSLCQGSVSRLIKNVFIKIIKFFGRIFGKLTLVKVFLRIFDPRRFRGRDFAPVNEFTHPYRQLFYDFYYASYMRRRAAALLEVCDIFDEFWDFHPLISQKMFEILHIRSQTLFPIVQLGPRHATKGGPINFLCTGQKTAYRISVVERLRRENPLSNFFLTGFQSDDTLLAQGLFTLNIPQTANWPLSSPVRIYRSLKAGIIPVSLRKFNDHPIENCSMSFCELDFENCDAAYASSLEVLNEQVRIYNSSAKRRWQSISELISISFISNNLQSVDGGRFLVLWSAPVAPPEFIKSQKGFNIVYFSFLYWAIPHDFGDVDLFDPAFSRNGMIRAESLSELEAKIAKWEQK